MQYKFSTPWQGWPHRTVMQKKFMVESTGPVSTHVPITSRNSRPLLWRLQGSWSTIWECRRTETETKLWADRAGNRNGTTSSRDGTNVCVCVCVFRGVGLIRLKNEPPFVSSSNSRRKRDDVKWWGRLKVWPAKASHRGNRMRRERERGRESGEKEKGKRSLPATNKTDDSCAGKLALEPVGYTEEREREKEREKWHKNWLNIGCGRTGGKSGKWRELLKKASRNKH